VGSEFSFCFFRGTRKFVVLVVWRGSLETQREGERKMKKFSIAVVAVLAMVVGVAGADVVVINSCGEEDLPVWITGCTASVNTTDSAGPGSDSCIQLDITSSWFEVFNDHYVADGGTPYDVSTAHGYVNFYVKVVSGTLAGEWNEVYGSHDYWTDGFGWEEPFVWPEAGGDWLYVSLEVASAPDTWGTMDWSAMDTVGLGADGTAGDIVLIDHWTMTTTPEEGMLGAGAEGEGEGEGEGEQPPPVPSGTPAAGLLGLGLVAAACALGGSIVMRRKQ